MKLIDLQIGKSYWIPSGDGKAIRKRLKSFSITSERCYFQGHIARLPEEIFETKKDFDTHYKK